MIREYTSKDFGQVVSLYIDVFTAEPFLYDWMERGKAERYIKDLENTPMFKAFLFYDEHEALSGFCLGTVNDYFQGAGYEIKEIVVAVKQQGKGNGSKFMAEMERKLVELGIGYISLITQKTIAAYHFYLKNGFELSEETAYMHKAI